MACDVERRKPKGKRGGCLADFLGSENDLVGQSPAAPDEFGGRFSLGEGEGAVAMVATTVKRWTVCQVAIEKREKMPRRDQCSIPSFLLQRKNDGLVARSSTTMLIQIRTTGDKLQLPSPSSSTPGISSSKSCSFSRSSGLASCPTVSSDIVKAPDARSNHD